MRKEFLIIALIALFIFLSGGIAFNLSTEDKGLKRIREKAPLLFVVGLWDLFINSPLITAQAKDYVLTHMINTEGAMQRVHFAMAMATNSEGAINDNEDDVISAFLQLQNFSEVIYISHQIASNQPAPISYGFIISQYLDDTEFNPITNKYISLLNSFPFKSEVLKISI